MADRFNIIIIILLIAGICGICGCITIKEVDYDQYLKDNGYYRPSVTPVPQAAALPPHGQEYPDDIPSNDDGISFNQAMNKLEMFDSEGMIDASNMTIYQIIATGADINGRADSWMLGVKNDNGAVLYSYERDGWIETGWPGPLTGEEIVIDEIISPEELFGTNNGVIAENYRGAGVTRSDIFLKNGVYTIALNGKDRITELRFKADTGELI